MFWSLLQKPEVAFSSAVPWKQYDALTCHHVHEESEVPDGGSLS